MSSSPEAAASDRGRCADSRTGEKGIVLAEREERHGHFHDIMRKSDTWAKVPGEANRIRGRTEVPINTC